VCQEFLVNGRFVLPSFLRSQDSTLPHNSIMLSPISPASKNVQRFVAKSYKAPEGSVLPERLLGISRTLRKLGFQDSPTKARAAVAAESTWEVRRARSKGGSAVVVSPSPLVGPS